MLRERGKLFAALASVIVSGLAMVGIAQGAATSSLQWQTNLEQAKQIAAQTNRLVLVHFWSPSCGPCKQLEKNVFAVPKVQQSVEAQFVPVKVNADDWPTTTKQYGITALPTDLIIKPDGHIVGRMISPSTPDAYLQQLAIVASGAGSFAGAPPPAYAANAAPAIGAGAIAPGAVAPTATGWGPATPSVPSAYTAAMPSANSTTPNAPASIAPNVAWGAPPASTSNSSTPAVPAYSDSRYAEYFQRFSAASSGTNAGISAANTPASTAPVSLPTAVAQPAYTQPAYAPPAYAPPTYAPPTASPATMPPANYRATAYGPSASVAPANAQTAYTTPPAASAPSGPAAAAATAAPGMTQPNTSAAPQLALDGFCPVTLSEEQRWQLGDRRWGVIHRGRTYLFAGPEQQRKFLADPDRYSPAVSGQDVVMAMDHGQDVCGKRGLGIVYQNRIYLFSSENSRQIFSQNPQRYATEVLQAEKQNSSTTVR
jgi:YHS domain-containing protein/thiol-disulfide isomerase/thioredoxin